MPKKRTSETAPRSSSGDPAPAKTTARKPRVAKSQGNGAVQPVPRLVRRKTPPAPVRKQGSTAAHSFPRDEVARLAYSYWESRGGRGGSPEEDWFRAEQEVLSRIEQPSAQ